MHANEHEEVIHTASVRAGLEALHALCSQKAGGELLSHLTEAIRRRPGEEDEAVEVALVDAEPPTFLLVEVRRGDEIHLVEIDLTRLSDTEVEVQFALTSPAAGWLSKAAGLLSGGQTLSAALADDLAAFEQSVKAVEKAPAETVGELVPQSA